MTRSFSLALLLACLLSFATSVWAATPHPCDAPAYRQFDFWVGDWQVRNPAGKVVGDNLVTVEQDGCLLVEHWKSTVGIHTGSSFNYYDVRDKKWAPAVHR